MTSGPPMSPDVLMQQMPPMSAYSGQASQMLNARPEDTMSADPSAFAKSELDKIAASLMNVAKALSQTKKELMPLVQKMAEAGAMLSNELQANNAPPGGGADQSPTGAPQGQGPGDVGLGA